MLSDKEKAAALLGKLGGLARAASLTPERRKEIAAQAAKARWEKHDREKGKREGDLEGQNRI